MQSANLSLPAALLIGLLVALNPCQLAINVSALTYIHKNSEGGKAGFIKGLMYATGRTLTYTILGWALTLIITRGNNIDAIRSLLSQGESILPYALLVVGIFLIGRVIFAHHHSHDDSCHHSGHIIKRKGPYGPFILGMILALAFCPESAIFYFGMMIPLAASSSTGWLVPLAFSLAASIPVIILSWLISTAIHSVHRFEHTFAHFQQWLNIITGAILILIAILMW